MKNDKEYKPLTHEELVNEIHRIMHDMSLEKQAAFVKTIKEMMERE